MEGVPAAHSKTRHKGVGHSFGARGQRGSTSGSTGASNASCWSAYPGLKTCRVHGCCCCRTVHQHGRITSSVQCSKKPRQNLRVHGEGLWRCLCSILEVDPAQSDSVREPATVPLSLGGLGFRSASRSRTHGFWASRADSLGMIRHHLEGYPDTQSLQARQRSEVPPRSPGT